MPRKVDGLAFARTFTPTKPRDSYSWVLSHGKEKIALCLRLTDVLDAKADSLLHYIGATALAVTVLLPFLPKRPPLTLLAWLAPALGALLMATIRALHCLKPSGLPALPTIRKAFKYADHFGDDAATRFYATMVPLEDRLRSLLDQKNTTIHSAHRYFLGALFWLPIAILALQVR